MAWVALAGAAMSAYAKANEGPAVRYDTTADAATFAHQFDNSGWNVNTGGSSMRDVEASGSNQSQPVSTSPSASAGQSSGASVLPNGFSGGSDNSMMLAVGAGALVLFLVMRRKKKR